MLYRPARMALHIGRVGALAVALGVGGGVLVSGFGAPVAQADSDLDNFGPSIGVSIGGHDIVQSGSASVSTQGRGSLAIAIGPQTSAIAEGTGNRAVVIGARSSATVRGGENNSALVVGNDNEVVAGNGVNNNVRVIGNNNENISATGGRNNNVTISGQSNVSVHAGCEAEGSELGSDCGSGVAPNRSLRSLIAAGYWCARK